MAKAKDQKPAAPAAKPARRRHDWEAIERDYRTGKFSLRELEAKHGAGYSDIAKRSKKEGWKQYLREAVKQATSAALIQEITTAATTQAQQTTTAVVMAAAEVHKQVILNHRKDIGETSRLAMELLGELRLVTHSQAELQSLLKMATEGMAPEDAMSVRQAFNDLVRVHSRVSSVHKLADTLVKLQNLERRAFDIDSEDDGRGGKTAPHTRSVFELTDDELMADIMARRGRPAEGAAA